MTNFYVIRTSVWCTHFHAFLGVKTLLVYLPLIPRLVWLLLRNRIVRVLTKGRMCSVWCVKLRRILIVLLIIMLLVELVVLMSLVTLRIPWPISPTVTSNTVWTSSRSIINSTSTSNNTLGASNDSGIGSPGWLLYNSPIINSDNTSDIDYLNVFVLDYYINMPKTFFQVFLKLYRYLLFSQRIRFSDTKFPCKELWFHLWTFLKHIYLIYWSINSLGKRCKFYTQGAFSFLNILIRIFEAVTHFHKNNFFQFQIFKFSSF